MKWIMIAMALVSGFIFGLAYPHAGILLAIITAKGGWDTATLAAYGAGFLIGNIVGKALDQEEQEEIKTMLRKCLARHKD